MRLSDGLWEATAAEEAADQFDVAYEELQVDELAMRLVTEPETMDVLLLPNLYGDIISDLCAGLVGGLGLAAGANLGWEYAVFEPVHGSAPDIAGKGSRTDRDDPLRSDAAPASRARPEGDRRGARRRRRSRGRQARDPDLGGEATTHEVGEAVAAQVS
jgi:isocitrate dehydrogenase (NAD+)